VHSFDIENDVTMHGLVLGFYVYQIKSMVEGVRHRIRRLSHSHTI